MICPPTSLKDAPLDAGLQFRDTTGFWVLFDEDREEVAIGEFLENIGSDSVMFKLVQVYPHHLYPRIRPGESLVWRRQQCS